MFARHQYGKMRRQAKATLIQKSYRGYRARKNFTRTREAIILLQCCVRRMRAKRELKQLKVCWLFLMLLHNIFALPKLPVILSFWLSWYL
jgi:hypothetical protein